MLTKLAGVLDQELERLPEKYRVPVLLWRAGGKGRRKVARQLVLPETVQWLPLESTRPRPRLRVDHRLPLHVCVSGRKC